MIAPKLWLALKPTQHFHIVVSCVMTGDTELMRCCSSASRGKSLDPLKVYRRCKSPSRSTIAALPAKRYGATSVNTGSSPHHRCRYVNNDGENRQHAQNRN